MDIARQAVEMIKILESVGYECEAMSAEAGVNIILTDTVIQSTGEFLVTKATADLLNCLAKDNKLKLSQEEDKSSILARMENLERRMSKLEAQATITSEVAELADEAKDETDLGQKKLLQELQARAKAIGTELEDYESCYCYRRNRFLIPGTRYGYYFTVTNALDPKRKMRPWSALYDFRKDELPLIEKWIEHDEKIYAECNEKYGVTQ